jgi:DNA-directed RNA polymerase specialized sigma24 family protein
MTPREQAAQLRTQGLTYAEIATTLSISPRTAFRWLNPDDEARCRKVSLAWKDRNRETNRARDNAYSARLDVRGRCTTCDGPMGIGQKRDGTCDGCIDARARERERRFVDLYNAGLPLSDIAARMGTTRNALGVLAHRLRREGRIGYRYSMQNGKRVAA